MKETCIIHQAVIDVDHRCYFCTKSLGWKLCLLVKSTITRTEKAKQHSLRSMFMHFGSLGMAFSFSPSVKRLQPMKDRK